MSGWKRVGPSGAMVYEPVPLSIRNAHVATDAAIVQSKLAFDAVQTYVPVWSSSGTQPAIGNGAIQGRYVRIGSLIIFHAEIVAGSTSTFGTGQYFLSLPVAGGAFFSRVIGVGLLYDLSSANSVQSLHSVSSGGANCDMTYPAASPIGGLTAVSNTVPWTWANGDIIRVTGHYLTA